MLPLLDQIREYGPGDLRGDLSAGLTVAVMLVPQGMAYAMIAGLPPIYGLYASFVPLVAYALLGTSRQLAVGPVAMVSLLVATGVSPLAGSDPALYIGLSVLLALMVGVLQLGLGLARFGFLTNFLSHPVLSGFTSAAALIIGLSQLKHLLGLDIPRSSHVHEILLNAIQQAGSVNTPTLLVGLAAVAVLVTIRWLKSGLPGALVVVVLSTLAVSVLKLTDAGVAIVGSVPSGLPDFAIPPLDVESVSALVPAALTIGLVGFMESIAVAKVYAGRHGYEVDANQELIALGAANLAGSVLQSYPVTGGFSRTAVNDQAGARTNGAAIVSAAIIGLTLLFLTDLFYFLPNAVLAAIVMVAVFKLIDWKEAAFLWKVDRKDFGLMSVTFLATLTLGIEQGVLVGVVASLLVVIYQTSRPHTAVLGKLPGTRTYRNLERNPSAAKTTGTVIFRMDASLFFANAEFLKDAVRRLLQDQKDVGALVLDFYPVNRVDSTGMHTLADIVSERLEAQVDVFFAGVKGPVFDQFRKAGLADRIGPNHFFLELDDAVGAAEASVKAKRNAQPGHSE